MSRDPAKPQVGYYKLRLVKGGPFVPARIIRICHCTIGAEGDRPHEWFFTCDRYPPLSAEINGQEADVARVWAYGRKIKPSEYDHLTALREWAKRHAPQEPEANPRHAPDLMSMAIPQF